MSSLVQAASEPEKKATMKIEVEIDDTGPVVFNKGAIIVRSDMPLRINKNVKSCKIEFGDNTYNFLNSQKLQIDNSEDGKIMQEELRTIISPVMDNWGKSNPSDPKNKSAAEANTKINKLVKFVTDRATILDMKYSNKLFSRFLNIYRPYGREAFSSRSDRIYKLNNKLDFFQNLNLNSMANHPSKIYISERVSLVAEDLSNVLNMIATITSNYNYVYSALKVLSTNSVNENEEKDVLKGILVKMFSEKTENLVNIGGKPKFVSFYDNFEKLHPFAYERLTMFNSTKTEEIEALLRLFLERISENEFDFVGLNPEITNPRTSTDAWTRIVKREGGKYNENNFFRVLQYNHDESEKLREKVKGALASCNQEYCEIFNKEKNDEEIEKYVNSSFTNPSKERGFYYLGEPKKDPGFFSRSGGKQTIKRRGSQKRGKTRSKK